jgi:hypothetical protein
MARPQRLRGWGSRAPAFVRMTSGECRLAGLDGPTRLRSAWKAPASRRNGNATVMRKDATWPLLRRLISVRAPPGCVVAGISGARAGPVDEGTQVIALSGQGVGVVGAEHPPAGAEVFLVHC